ncbi:MAG: hypothetical protein EBY48_03690, partial [Opitutae bacterium]|nr:hypothetical protein [Opitutae bacterium]
MRCKLFASTLLSWIWMTCLGHAAPNQFPESPNFTTLSEQGFFAGLTVGDNREVVLQKLQSKGYLGYKELQSNLIKSPIRWDGHAYELTCKFKEDQLMLCLIQGEAGWQEFFYEDIVKPQWSDLRKRVVQIYGKPNKSVEFPHLYDVPLNDEGGLVTDQWELDDRTIILCLHAYSKQD